MTAGPRSVGVWRASDGRLIRLLVGPEGPFTAAAFLPDSRTIVARTEAGVVAAYECRICGEVAELLALADERLGATGRALTPEERERTSAESALEPPAGAARQESVAAELGLRGADRERAAEVAS